MVRPVTELVLLEEFQRQVFVLLQVLEWTVPEVADFFDQLFENMSFCIGCRYSVPGKQWQGRKEKWGEQWRHRSTDETLRLLEHQPLWYSGGIDVTIRLPPTDNADFCLHSFKLEFDETHSEIKRHQFTTTHSDPNPEAEVHTAPPLITYPEDPDQLVTPNAYRCDTYPYPELVLPAGGQYDYFSDDSLINPQSFPTTYHLKEDAQEEPHPRV